MKPSFILLPLAAAALAAAVSCNREPAPAASPAEPNEIVFSAGGAMAAEVTTKASEVTSLQSSGFYVSASSGTTTESQLWSNAAFSHSSGKYKGSKYWPLENNGIHFYASNANMSFGEDGFILEGVSASTKDVVCAYLPSPTWKEPNDLTFEHIFARIGVVNVTPPAGYNVSGFSITFTPFISGNYNIKTGEWSSKAVDSSSPNKSIANAATSSNDNNLWLVPGEYELTATYTLEKGAGAGRYQENFTKVATVNLVAGKISSIQTTLPDGNASEILFNVTVTPWGSNAIAATFTDPQP